MSLLLLIVLLGVLLVGGGIAFAVALARRSADRYAEQNEVLPGVSSRAPAAWAGAHSPEALLHRRIGEAVRGLRAQSELGHEDVGQLELRVELEQHALAVDERLVAAAAMAPGPHRQRALAELEVSVVAIEQAAGDLARSIGRAGASSDVMGLEDLAARIKGLTAEG